MKRQNLQTRTKQFALQVIKFCENLPKDETSRIIARQLLRSGTSVGANYRAACLGKSKPTFISKWATCLRNCSRIVWCQSQVACVCLSTRRPLPQFRGLPRGARLLERCRSSDLKQVSLSPKCRHRSLTDTRLGAETPSHRTTSPRARLFAHCACPHVSRITNHASRFHASLTLHIYSTA